MILTKADLAEMTDGQMLLIREGVEIGIALERKRTLADLEDLITAFSDGVYDAKIVLKNYANNLRSHVE